MEVNKVEKTTNFIVNILKWWKLLLIIGVVAAVVSLLVSFLITPKYKSKVVILPTSTNAVSQVLLEDGNYNEFLDATQFGNDINVDQMLQILNSRNVKDYLIEKFNLIDYYELDTTTKYWKTKLYKYLESDITCKRTSFMGVEIIVVSKNAQMAADIANAVADYYDQLKKEIIQQRTLTALNVMEKVMEDYEQLLREQEDSLSKIMSHGVYDYETQSERLYQQYAKELAAGNNNAIKRLKEEMKILEEWGPRYLSLSERIINLRLRQQGIQAKYEGMKMDARYELSQKFIVERATVSDKKFYPKKSVIVIVSTLCSMGLALFLLLSHSTLSTIYQGIRSERKKNNKA